MPYPIVTKPSNYGTRAQHCNAKIWGGDLVTVPSFLSYAWCRLTVGHPAAAHRPHPMSTLTLTSLVFICWFIRKFSETFTQIAIENCMNLRLSPDEPLLTNRSTMHNVYKKTLWNCDNAICFQLLLDAIIKNNRKQRINCPNWYV